MTQALSKASWTTLSDSESNALVASSRRRTVGDLIMARAIAILCFCPPDICTPLSPTFDIGSSTYGQVVLILEVHLNVTKT
ncbi:hypothetical protein N665_1159s0013 [Sinapis alba]|nr:hypothetical protein N665_1159s0013 [Sinapis alba]